MVDVIGRLLHFGEVGYMKTKYLGQDITGKDLYERRETNASKKSCNKQCSTCTVVMQGKKTTSCLSIRVENSKCI